MSDQKTQELAEAFADGRDLSTFDMKVLNMVAAFVIHAEDALQRMSAEGAIVDSDKGAPVEHPAMQVATTMSKDIREWVKTRPDLLGERRAKPGAKRAKFQPLAVVGE